MCSNSRWSLLLGGLYCIPSTSVVRSAVNSHHRSSLYHHLSIIDSRHEQKACCRYLDKSPARYYSRISVWDELRSLGVIGTRKPFHAGVALLAHCSGTWTERLHETFLIRACDPEKARGMPSSFFPLLTRSTPLSTLIDCRNKTSATAIWNASTGRSSFEVMPS